MRVLHIAPHLGGGIGKAHAVVSRVLPKDIEQTFVLLEEPIDMRAVHMLRSAGRKVIVTKDLALVAQLAGQHDVVQFEFINHPRLLECLVRAPFPAIRSVFWAHISGLFKPIIPLGLIDEAQRFIFTSECSRPLAGNRTQVSVINSGFGFGTAIRPRPKRMFPRIAYLGTCNFAKMHPGFFEVLDHADHSGPTFIWGHLDIGVATTQRAMAHPQRAEFFGETLRPAEALSQADIFFYPLQPRHYGTGENALVEAMAMGIVPLVLNNPAELEIVTHEKTGLVASSIEDCKLQLDRLLSLPDLRKELSENAAKHVAATRTPEISAKQLVSLWQEVAAEPPKYCNFEAVLGKNPLDWFIATQGIRAITEQEYQGTTKGTLAHFKRVFAGDESLIGL